MSKKWIEVTGVQCPVCEERIWSTHRHDFHYCECGYCFVDGGRDYLRTGWGFDSEGFVTYDWEPPRTVKLKVDEPKIKYREFMF
jgi:hypothetical protein